MYPVVVAIDLETTGADPYADRIIEVGALILEDGVPAGEFSELVNPGAPLSPGIIKLTGITPDMLKDARDADSVLEDFLEFLPDDALCIAHNAAFDRQFLRAASQALSGLPAKQLSRYPGVTPEGRDFLTNEIRAILDGLAAWEPGK